MSEMIIAEHHKSVEVMWQRGYYLRLLYGDHGSPQTRSNYSKDFDYDEFRNYLNDLGDSPLVVNDDEIVKVHVHTEDPGLVMQEGLKYGSLIKVKVDNMRNQHEAQVEKRSNLKATSQLKKKEYALIAVVAGQGLADIFRAQGVDYVIEGGQTMNLQQKTLSRLLNRSMLATLSSCQTTKISFMAAQSAAEVFEQPAVVVEARTSSRVDQPSLPFDPSKSIEENKERMTAALGDVISGSVTTAVRDTTIDGLETMKTIIWVWSMGKSSCQILTCTKP